MNKSHFIRTFAKNILSYLIEMKHGFEKRCWTPDSVALQPESIVGNRAFQTTCETRRKEGTFKNGSGETRCNNHFHFR